MSSQVYLNAKTAAAVPPATNYRLSTKHLLIANCLLKTAAFYVAYSQNPRNTLTGALCGAALRWFATVQGDRDQQVIELGSASERLCRANQVASICLTSCTAAYTGYTPGPHSVAPFLLGFQAVSDGVYPLLRRAMD